MIELEKEIDPFRSLSLQDMSYTRISTFDDCQAKYFYSYIIKKPQEFGHAATLGNIIHKALEETLDHGYKIDTLELLEQYKAAIPIYDPELQIPHDMIKNGEIMLREFVDANPGEVNVYAKELPFSFVLGRARINGYIDFVAVHNAFVLVRDYKSGSREVAAKAVPENLQLGIYSLYAKHLFPDKEIRSELYYLKSGRVKGHLFSDDELSSIESNLTDKINTILDTVNFKETKNEFSCRWCSYAKDGTCNTGKYRLNRRSSSYNEYQ
jgi:RecB family exonuclease